MIASRPEFSASISGWLPFATAQPTKLFTEKVFSTMAVPSLGLTCPSAWADGAIHASIWPERRFAYAVA